MTAAPASDPAAFFGRPHLPPGLRYALLLHAPRMPASLQKPVAFADLAGLARGLHRRRGDAPLQLADVELLTRERRLPARGVAVWVLDPLTGDRRACLGWAYLAGAGRPTLEAALHACQPIAAEAA